MSNIIWKWFIVIYPMLLIFGCAKTPQLSTAPLVTSENTGKAEANLVAITKALNLALPEATAQGKKYLKLAAEFIKFTNTNVSDLKTNFATERNENYTIIEQQKETIVGLRTEATILKAKWYVQKGQLAEKLFKWWRYGIYIAIWLRLVAFFTPGLGGRLLAKVSKYMFIVLSCGILLIHEFLTYIWTKYINA